MTAYPNAQRESECEYFGRFILTLQLKNSLMKFQLMTPSNSIASAHTAAYANTKARQAAGFCLLDLSNYHTQLPQTFLNLPAFFHQIFCKWERVSEAHLEHSSDQIRSESKQTLLSDDIVTSLDI